MAWFVFPHKLVPKSSISEYREEAKESKNEVGKCYWFISVSFTFLFFALLFVHISFFTFAPMPCYLLCCICSCYFILLVFESDGKRNCLCWVFWFNKEKEEALYVFGHTFFGFLLEVCLIAVGSCWWSQPSWICGKGGNFLYFWELCLRTANAIAHCT